MMSIFEQILAEAARREQTQAEVTAAVQQAKKAELNEMVNFIENRGRRQRRGIVWGELIGEMKAMREAGADNHAVAQWVSNVTGFDVENHEVGKVFSAYGVSKGQGRRNGRKAG